MTGHAPRVGIAPMALDFVTSVLIQDATAEWHVRPICLAADCPGDCPIETQTLLLEDKNQRFSFMGTAAQIGRVLGEMSIALSMYTDFPAKVDAK